MAINGLPALIKGFASTTFTPELTSILSHENPYSKNTC
jgi:hypothetical protein